MQESFWSSDQQEKIRVKMERGYFCIFKAHLILIQPTVYGNTTINILLNKATATFNSLNKDVLAGFFASIYLGLNSRKHTSTNHHSTPHTVTWLRWLHQNAIALALPFCQHDFGDRLILELKLCNYKMVDE